MHDPLPLLGSFGLLREVMPARPVMSVKNRKAKEKGSSGLSPESEIHGGLHRAKGKSDLPDENNTHGRGAGTLGRSREFALRHLLGSASAQEL